MVEANVNPPQGVQEIERVGPQPVPVNVQIGRHENMLSFVIESVTGAFVFFLPVEQGPALREAIAKYEESVSKLVVPEVDTSSLKL